jgi:hypothetical protein
LTASNLYSFVSVNFNYTLSSPPTIRTATGCNFVAGAATITCLSPVVPFSASYDVSITVGNITGSLFRGYSYSSPSVNSISPSTGSTTGNFQISINGVNFGSGSGLVIGPVVTFDGNTCTNATRQNDSLITCTAPAVWLK